jgi:hypothetical protein
MYDDDDTDEFEALQSIKRKMGSANAKIIDRLERLTEKTEAGNMRLLEAFARIADAMEGVERELRACAKTSGPARWTRRRSSRRRARGADAMPMDKQDYDLVKELRELLRENGNASSRKLDLLLRTSEASLKNDERLIEAFNRVAVALEHVAGEVRELHEELSPSIDKPKRLPAPGGRR